MVTSKIESCIIIWYYNLVVKEIIIINNKETFIMVSKIFHRVGNFGHKKY